MIERIWIHVSTYLPYSDVITLGSINKELSGMWKKWENSIWQVQCYNRKYINDLHKDSLLMAWKDIFRILHVPKEYAWDISSPSLQRIISSNVHYFSRPAAFTFLTAAWSRASVLAYEQEFGPSGYDHTAVGYTYSAGPMYLQLIIGRHPTTNGVNLRVILILFRTERASPHRYRLTWIMNDGSLFHEGIMTYYGTGGTIIKEFDSPQISELIHQGIVNLSDDAFEVNPLRFVLVYD